MIIPEVGERTLNKIHHPLPNTMRSNGYFLDMITHIKVERTQNSALKRSGFKSGGSASVSVPKFTCRVTLGNKENLCASINSSVR